MNEKQFNKLLDPAINQIFVFDSMVSVPLCFARHPWIVVAPRGGGWTRFEVLSLPNEKKEHGRHVYKNHSSPTVGMPFFGGGKKYFFRSRLIGVLVDKDESFVGDVSAYLENHISSYENKETYRYWPGPNSNSFVQWVLDQIPGHNLQLPWNAFGKKYYRRKVKRGAR